MHNSTCKHYACAYVLEYHDMKWNETWDIDRIINEV